MSASVQEPGRARELLLQSYGLIQALAVLAILVIVMSILSPRFLTWINLTNLMGQMAVPLIVAAGMTIVMISGEFDISVGSVVALCAAVSAWLMTQVGIVPAVLLSLAIGPAIGWVNGIITTKGKIPSFIVTLGTLMMARSLAFVVTGGQVLSNLPDAFRWIGTARLGGVPISFLVALSFYAIGWLVLTRTAFGKRVYAVGANRMVATLSGIRADRVKIQCLMIVGFCAAFAGNILLARIGAIQADTGRGLEFEVIAAVVIGGTSLYGGQGNILRTIIGAIIIGAVLLDALQKRVGRR